MHTVECDMRDVKRKITWHMAHCMHQNQLQKSPIRLPAASQSGLLSTDTTEVGMSTTARCKVQK